MSSLSRRLAPRAAVVLAAIGLAVAGCTATSTVAAPANTDGLIVVASAPGDVPGYSRGCGAGEGCVFGPAWSDDVTVTGGHNGCDTRNDILNQTLTNKTHRTGTHECVVLSGDFTDPYSGQSIHFDKSHASDVQVDHVYALAVAWDRGAATWTIERRRDFANDPDNLILTTAANNQAKRDATPATWLPEADTGRCLFTQRFVAIATKYALPITSEEERVVRETAARCPT